MSRVSGSLPAAATAAALAVAAAAWADPRGHEAWPAAVADPHPQADDLVLPMPCGGVMPFRRIEVPAANALDDRRITVGGGDERFAYAENRRPSWLAGGFTDPKRPNARAFYLAKYLTTRAQYGAFAEPCATVDTDGRLPAVNVTWTEAVAFADRYNEWLYRNAPARLPKEDGASGFLRLPTEDEWEFAARGGIAVSQAEFEQPAFPMPEGIGKYVWFQGSRSSDNQLQPVGLLKPNPLGLYDILGDADELVLDPFRLDKLNRLHGQAGGAVIKGGNYLTSENDIRASSRQELLPYDKGGARRVRTVGFRLALVPPVITSAGRLASIETLWKELPSVALGSAAEAQEDPIAELQAVTQATDDPALHKRLENLSTVIKANIAARNQQRQRAAKSTIRLGAFLGVKLSEDLHLVERKRTILSNLRKANASSDVVKQGEAALSADEAAIKSNIDYYQDLVVQLAGDYPPQVIDTELATLNLEFGTRGLAELSRLAAHFVDDAARYRSGGKFDPAGLMARFSHE